MFKEYESERKKETLVYVRVKNTYCRKI